VAGSSRRWSRVLITLLLAVATVVVGSAFISNSHPRIKVAKEVATWRWGNVCDGNVSIRKGPLKPPLIAWASWSRDNGGKIIDCSITYSDSRHWEWWDICRATAHEFGHLEGWTAKPGHEFVWRDRHGLHHDFGHSRKRSSLMWPWTLEPYGPCGRDHDHPRRGRSALQFQRRASSPRTAAGSSRK
jgi:hypothetical protein